MHDLISNDWTYFGITNHWWWRGLQHATSKISTNQANDLETFCQFEKMIQEIKIYNLSIQKFYWLVHYRMNYMFRLKFNHQVNWWWRPCNKTQYPILVMTLRRQHWSPTPSEVATMEDIPKKCGLLSAHVWDHCLWDVFLAIPHHHCLTWQLMDS